MEIIDKRHVEYRKNIFGSESRLTISVYHNKIYFSKKTLEVFELNENSKIHFVSDAGRLFIYFNNDDNGISLVTGGSPYGLIVSRSKMIVDILKKRHPGSIKPPCKFAIKPMLSKINESVTAEILLNKTI